MTRCFFVVLASAVAAGSCLAQRGPDSAKGVPLDGIAAVVNGSVITYLEVQDQIAAQILMLQRAYPDDRTNYFAKAQELYKDELDQVIERKLIMGEYERGEYSTNWVDPAVKEAINDDIKNTYGGSRAKLIQTLRERDGKTYEDYVKQQREFVIVHALANFHTGGGKVIISPSAIEKYYADHRDDFKVEDQVKLRMIAIPQPEGSPPGTAKEIATEILKKIDGGVPFADMAKVYSSGSDRANGGDRGWVDRKHNVKEISDVAFSLKAGQHSQVVEVGTACYLLMVDDVRAAHDSPLTEVQGAIEQTLQIQKAKSLQDQWIQRLKAKSHVEYF